MQIIGLYALVKSFLWFIPLGFFLPLLFKRFRDFKEMLMMDITVSLLLALFKFIVRLTSYGGRNVNIGEIIVSALGGMTGYVIYKKIQKFLR